MPERPGIILKTLPKSAISGFYFLLRILVLFLFLCPCLWAQTPSPTSSPWSKAGGHKEKGTEKESRKYSELQMSDQQKTRIQEIRAGYTSRMEDIVFEMQREGFNLADELKKAEPERSNIDAIIDRLAELKKKRYKLILDEYFEIRKVLTPDQQKIYTQRFIRQMRSQSLK